MRLVLDTNVVVSALLWGGEPGRRLRLGQSPESRLITSAPLVAELTETLSRNKFHDRIIASLPGLDELVDLYIAFAAVVKPVPVPRLAPDPDDDVVIGTAIAGKAQLVITGDRTLLSVAVYEGGRIMPVAEALQTLGPSSQIP